MAIARDWFGPLSALDLGTTELLNAEAARRPTHHRFESDVQIAGRLSVDGHDLLLLLGAFQEVLTSEQRQQFNEIVAAKQAQLALGSQT